MTRAKSAFVFIAGLFVTACAHAPVSLNDNLVVPGERIGEVEIGMSLAELLNLKGVPNKTIPMHGSAATTYFFDGLTVAAEDRVYWIVAKNPKFQTQNGVAPGVEQIFARASFGKPDCVVSQSDTTIYDYGNFYFDVDNGTGLVRQLGVQERTRMCKG